MACVLGGAIVEVQANLLIGLNQVLLARDAEDARGVVLVDVLRSQTVDRIRGEPRASNAPGRVLLKHVLRALTQSFSWTNQCSSTAVSGCLWKKRNTNGAIWLLEQS